MVEKIPKLWVLADWQDVTGLIHREEFGPFYSIDLSDGIMIPNNDVDSSFLFPEEEDGWIGFNPESKKWDRHYYSVYCVTRDACGDYNPCGCSSSNDSHCMYCIKPALEHGPEAVKIWEAEQKFRMDS